VAALSDSWARIGLGLAGLVVLTLVLASCGGGSGAPEAVGASPKVERFELASYKRVDPDVDPKGGLPVYIVERDIVVQAKMREIKRLDVILSVGASDRVAFVSVTPDADGNVDAKLRLPEGGAVYVLQGAAILADQQAPRERYGTFGNELAISAGPLRVMAEP